MLLLAGLRSRIRAVAADRRFYRFLAVGASCFSVNLLVLYLCTEKLGFHYLVSMLLSIVVVSLMAWALNRNWTFRSRDARPWAEMLRFMSATFTSCLIGLLLMALFVSVLGIHYLVANIVIAAGMTLANFILHRDWTFRPNKP